MQREAAAPSEQSRGRPPVQAITEGAEELVHPRRSAGASWQGRDVPWCILGWGSQ